MKPLVVTEYLSSNYSVDLKPLREDLFDYFNTLHYMLSDTEFDHISKYAHSWIEDHLRDEETLQRSIELKALEIGTGDHLRDYFEALLLRRDQLLAARDVFREYASHLRDIFSQERDQVMESLKSFDFDNGIYLRAVEYQKARASFLKSYGDSLTQELNEIEHSIQDVLDGSVTEQPKKTKKRTVTKKSADAPKKSGRYFHKNI